MNAPQKSIILGCKHGGLSVVRSLRKQGIALLVLTYNPNEFGLTSRYVDEWHICPHPSDEELFINKLLTYAEEWKGAFIISTGDYYAEAISKNKERLRPYFHTSVADWDHTQIFLEKDQTYQLADEVGVPHPYFFKPCSMQDLDNQIENLKLPMMIKPIHSHRFASTFHTKLFICETIEELRTNFQRVLDAGLEVVISEIIPGDDYKTLETVQMYINRKGEVAVAFCFTKLRQIPPMYGVMRVGKSMKPNTELIELTLKLLRKIDYRGYAAAEFKRDPRDNQLKLIEVNIRLLRVTQLAISSSVDFPYIMFQDKVNNEQIIVKEYDENTYFIELIADFTNYIRREPRKLLHIRHVLEPYVSRKAYAVLAFDDLKPFLAYFGAKLEKVQRLFKR